MKRRNNASDVVYVNVAILCNRTWPEKKKCGKPQFFSLSTMQSLRLMWFYHFHSILRCPFFVYIRSMYLQNIICTYLFRLFGLFSQLGESNHKICIALYFKVKASHSEIRWSSLFIAQTAHRIAARTKSTEFSNFSEVPMMVIEPYADRLVEHQPPAH